MVRIHLIHNILQAIENNSKLPEDLSTSYILSALPSILTLSFTIFCLQQNLDICLGHN